VVAVIVGIIAGPLVTNGFNPYSWEGHDEITKQLTRCIIAIQVQFFLQKTTKKETEINSAYLFFLTLIFRSWLSGLNCQSNKHSSA
jgi:hypothetical protein